MSVALTGDEPLFQIRRKGVLKKNDSDKRIFVVHRHLGAILHYDLRIELNGVLKNWALPSGPSMNCGDRRLAIMTNDKPLSLATIRGFREYDDGLIEGWDRGTVVPHSIYSGGCSDQDILEQIADGRFRFTLRGKKLKGVFSLVRLNGPESANWILLKGNDKYAVSYPYRSEDFIAGNSPINKYLKSLVKGIPDDAG